MQKLSEAAIKYESKRLETEETLTVLKLKT